MTAPVWALPASTRMPVPAGLWQEVSRPWAGAKPREGSSALIRTSIAWPDLAARPVGEVDGRLGKPVERDRPRIAREARPALDEQRVDPFMS